MKCPHCEYQDGWDNDKLEIVEGEHGRFYTLPVKMTRPSDYTFYNEEVGLFACPSCEKLSFRGYV